MEHLDVMEPVGSLDQFTSVRARNLHVLAANC